MSYSARKLARVFVALAAVLLMFGEAAYAKTDKPNILVIWGDDIGYDNISAYNLGMTLSPTGGKPAREPGP